MSYFDIKDKYTEAIQINLKVNFDNISSENLVNKHEIQISKLLIFSVFAKNTRTVKIQPFKEVLWVFTLSY